MNLVFLLPSLGYGIYLFASTGSPILLVLSGLTVLVWLVFSNQKRFDLTAEVVQRQGSVWLGDKRLSRFTWLWSVAVRNVVYPALYPEPKLKLDFSELPDWAWGLTAQGEPVPAPISRTSPHVLVIGQTGSGKTELLKRAIAAFQQDVVVIDFKGGGDYEFMTREIRLFDAAQAEQAVQAVEARLQQAGTPVLFVVDELAEALRNPRLSQQLESLCSRGRSLGAHFLGASQTMTGIPRSIWSNCQSRIAIRADPIDRSQLGMPVKPLATDQLGYAELSSGGLTGFFFPEHRPVSQELLGNPLLAREESRLWTEPAEEFAQFRRTPWGQ